MARAGIDVNVVVDAAGESRLAELDVDAAWVTADAARTGDPEAHDDRLARACDRSRALHPVPVLVPPVGVAGAYDRARRIAETAPCRVVRLCPTGHGYPLTEWVLSPLPELCEREGLALVIDFEPDRVRWEEVVAFARSFPSVPMVVLGVDIGDRVVPAALDTAPNVVVEVSQLRGADDLGRLVGTFGPARFAWGSGGLDARDRIAQLDGDAREAILSGNARALAGGTYAESFL